MHGMCPVAVDNTTIDVVDTGDVGSTVKICLQITCPVLAAGRDSNSPNPRGGDSW
jgi:hypothetical protein